MGLEGLLGAVLLALALVAFWVLRSPSFKGVHGESKVNSALRKRLDEHEYRVLTDLTLPSGDGTTQIDHVVVSRFGLFVIETKNMKGWIYGSPDQARWTQVIYRHKSSFQNPRRQNYKHVKAVQELLGIEEHQLHNVVVFVGSSVPKTPMTDDVVWGGRSLVEYIEAKRDVVFETHELERLAESLRENGLQSSAQNRRAHARYVRDQITKRQDVTKCPRCGADLVERTNRQSGERFFGCSRFPRCRGTRRPM